MAIKIHTKKIKTIDGPRYRVVEIEALPTTRLPRAYVGSAPWCRSQDKTLYVCSIESSYYVHVGHSFSKEQFEKIINDLRKCGENLRRVNQEIAAKNEGWEGEETFVV